MEKHSEIRHVSMSALERLRSNARLLAFGARARRRMRGIDAAAPVTVADVIEKRVREAPERVAIRFDDRAISYREYDGQANRYARWARAQGVRRGDVVALLMENRPEFLFAWLGLAKLGAVTALINHNLSGQPLAHSLRVSNAKHLVLGAELGEKYATCASQLETKPRVWATGGAVAGAEDLDAALAGEAEGALEPELRRGMRAGDNLFFIYTSGTTGLPKAANFSHHRFLIVSAIGCALAGLDREDRMYSVLPLYHAAGGVNAVGSALTTGASVVLARRFSASRFWSDCVQHGATTFVYIGELCRYLLNAAEHPDERRHRIRAFVGNGLRPEIWKAFQERFRIPRIVELYGATEGNVPLYNLDGKIGAVGRHPRFLRRLVDIRIVRFDVEREEVVRGPDGFCIECAPGEAGEAIGRIGALQAFEGYSDARATEKKVLRDVFAKGDAWFRSGDLLRADEDDYYYFVDRIGDTFRWKGENVSTAEVAEVLSRCPSVREANVYGVGVPGRDGRAGMAALVVDPGFDVETLHRHAAGELAPYARPLFLRIRPEIEVTSTFKHRKLALVEEGFDPERTPDPLYFADPEKQAFVPLDREVYARIVAGGYRL